VFELLGDDPCIAQPATSCNEDSVTQVLSAVPQTIVTVAENVGMLVGSCHTLLCRDQKMYHICQHIVSGMLIQGPCDDCTRTSSSVHQI
jgi:hypothetical protein